MAGTRPEIIKVAPIIREILDRNEGLYFVLTGQHYDYSLSRQMISDLELPKPDLSFQLKSSSPAGQISEIVKKLDNVLSKGFKKYLVIVQGDTNSVLAAALAAVKSMTPLAHVEAGLRSFDWRMPEEHNRRMVDHVSNYLFAPTQISMQNLLDEKVFGHVFVTGNTIIDAVNQHMPIAERESDIRQMIPFSEYILATFHRAENVDDKNVLRNIVMGLLKSDLPIVIPLHPRTRKRLRQYHLFEKLDASKNAFILPPQGYLDFLVLMKNSRLIITDSGGIQEEATAPVIRKKTIVLRKSTERQESIQARFAVLVKLTYNDIAQSLTKSWSKKVANLTSSPYGDGLAAKRIVDILRNKKYR